MTTTSDGDAADSLADIAAQLRRIADAQPRDMRRGRERNKPLPDQWEPLYRAEKRRADAAEAAVARVRALCDYRGVGEMCGPDAYVIREALDSA